MASEQIRKITDEDFQSLTAKGVTLVDFYADWCGPCKMLSPILEQVALDLIDKVTVFKLDTEHSPKAPTQFGVTSIPTLILFKDGVEVSRVQGLKDANTLKQFVQTAL